LTVGRPGSPGYPKVEAGNHAKDLLNQLIEIYLNGELAGATFIRHPVETLVFPSASLASGKALPRQRRLERRARVGRGLSSKDVHNGPLVVACHVDRSMESDQGDQVIEAEG